MAGSQSMSRRAGAGGSGKTTLLHLITGRPAPTAGEIARLTDRVAVPDQHVGQERKIGL